MDIKATRIKAGLTQEQAAALVRVSRRTWLNWEHGHTTMPGAAQDLFKLLAQPKEEEPTNQGE